VQAILTASGGSAWHIEIGITQAPLGGIISRDLSILTITLILHES